MEQEQKITAKEKIEPLYADLKTWLKTQSGYVLLDHDALPRISVILGKNEEQFQKGLIEIKIVDEMGMETRVNVSVDVLTSVIRTAYDPKILYKALGIFQHILIRLKSKFYAWRG